jgi:hypothetical protein
MLAGIFRTHRPGSAESSFMAKEGVRGMVQRCTYRNYPQGSLLYLFSPVLGNPYKMEPLVGFEPTTYSLRMPGQPLIEWGMNSIRGAHRSYGALTRQAAPGGM